MQTYRGVKKNPEPNLLYLHQYYITEGDWGGTRSFEFTQKLRQDGIAVTVITASNNPSQHLYRTNTKDHNGVKVIYINIKYQRFGSLWRRIAAFLGYAVVSTCIALSIKPTHVFATSTPLSIAIPGYIISRWFGCRYVLEIRDLWPKLPIAFLNIKSKLAISLLEVFEKWCYKSPNHIIALSPDMAGHIKSKAGVGLKISVIPNIATTLKPQSQGKSKNIHSKFGVGTDEILGLYAGSIGPINGLEYLVDLAFHLQQANSKIRILVVGNGSEKCKLVRYADQLRVLQKTIFFHNPLPKNRMAELFSAVDFGFSIFSTKYPMESNSANKFFDTLGAGRPIVINYSGWQMDLIIRRGCGISLVGLDAEQSLDRLRGTIENPQWRYDAGERARRLARSAFSAEKSYKKFRNVLFS